MKKLVNVLFSALLLSPLLLSCGDGVKGEWVSKNINDNDPIVTLTFSGDGKLKEIKKNKDGELISSREGEYAYEEPILIFGGNKYFVNGKAMVRYETKAEKTTSGSFTEDGEWVYDAPEGQLGGFKLTLNREDEYSAEILSGGKSTPGCFWGTGTYISKFNGEETNLNTYYGKYEFNEKNNTLIFIEQKNSISLDPSSNDSNQILRGIIAENKLYYSYSSSSVFEKK